MTFYAVNTDFRLISRVYYLLFNPSLIKSLIDFFWHFKNFRLSKDYYMSLNAFWKTRFFPFNSNHYCHNFERNTLRTFFFKLPLFKRRADINFKRKGKKKKEYNAEVLAEYLYNTRDYTYTLDNNVNNWKYSFNNQKLLFGLTEKPNILNLLGGFTKFNIQKNKGIYFFNKNGKLSYTYDIPKGSYPIKEQIFYFLYNYNRKKHSYLNLNLGKDEYKDVLGDLSDYVLEFRKSFLNKSSNKLYYYDMLKNRSLWKTYNWTIVLKFLVELIYASSYSKDDWKDIFRFKENDYSWFDINTLFSNRRKLDKLGDFSARYSRHLLLSSFNIYDEYKISKRVLPFYKPRYYSFNHFKYRKSNIYNYYNKYNKFRYFNRRYYFKYINPKRFRRDNHFFIYLPKHPKKKLKKKWRKWPKWAKNKWNWRLYRNLNYYHERQYNRMAGFRNPNRNNVPSNSKKKEGISTQVKVYSMMKHINKMGAKSFFQLFFSKKYDVIGNNWRKDFTLYRWFFKKDLKNLPSYFINQSFFKGSSILPMLFFYRSNKFDDFVFEYKEIYILWWTSYFMDDNDDLEYFIWN